MVAVELTPWVPHPEVWVLIVGLTVLYAYAGRVIGPKVVPAGEPPITRSQRRWFVVGILLLWGAVDWPVHDIGEEHLYFVHMIQHLALMLLVPPIMLMATPEWLARLVVGDGRVNAGMRRLARPVPAGAAFALLTLVSHAPVVVNTAASNGLFHYGVHAILVTSALLFWLPVCGPFPELRISVPAQMIYLFVASLVPTVPGAWMIFADGAVYSTYDTPARLWGISVTSDQQVAGAIMKLVGGTYLWVVITGLFFRWASGQEARDRGQVLTFDQVTQEFDEHPAPAAGA
jgi:putative membrane protein